MILVDWQILDRITRGFITVEPFDPALVQPNSLDIKLGNHFVWYEESAHVIDPYRQDTIASGTRECVGDSIVLAPGQFLLAEGRSGVCTLRFFNHDIRDFRLHIADMLIRISGPADQEQDQPAGDQH